ncbi:MAG TPA: MFS transporter [Flavobacteriales bacterium]|nr:MFS transporter [Flavobacteriales bacterium]
MTDSNTVPSGHPKGLYTLFFSEMWERFCYYGMRTLLTLYLVKSLLKGDSEASLMYGAYTALIYAAPVLGGKLADQYLGYRYAILLGAVFMAIGEFMILGGNEMFLLIGMGALIVGNGYFKANISTIVGKLYQDDDPRRDSGFTIFYIGINIGALLATTVVAYVGETYGFQYGFGLAGLGMLSGLMIFWLGRENYSAAPGLELREAGLQMKWGMKVYQLITLASLLLIPLCYVLILKNSFQIGGEEGFTFPLMTVLLTLLFVYVAYSLIKAGIAEGEIWRDRMVALVLFMVINVIFWACFEQAGTSLTLFADRNVDRVIMGWEMPASMTQFFNPFFIVLFGSIFTWMWVQLDRIGKNPSIPMKFSLGILQLGLGFLVTIVGLQFVNEATAMVPLLTLLFLYMLHTTGELFLSPIGLSMVTKLAPKSMAGTAMGGWFLSFAIANYAGGLIATLTGGHGGSEVIEAGLSDLEIRTAGLGQYIDVFSTLGMVLVAFAVLIAVCNKPLNKLMHGVR